MKKKNTISTLLILLTFSFVTQAQDRVTGYNFATRSEVIAQNGMVCTSHPLATQIGLDILKKGGTAIDAAIAANAALGLMEPTGCGIGGDLFAIVWDAETEQLFGLNSSGPSPKNLTLDYFKEKGMTRIPSYGPLPVNVPGAAAGWFALHEKFGKLEMSEILDPAIQYAENGFPVTELIAYYLDVGISNFRRRGFPNVDETYTINGKIPEKGDIFTNPKLADTYRKLAAGVHDAFYKGDIARTIANFIQGQGGFLSYEDLASFEPEWVDPVSIDYRGYDVWELPPNGQGIAALQILNILEGFDLQSMGFGTAEYIHTFVEAKKLAYEDRAKYYADPRFADVPLEQLLSKEYAAQRRQHIDPERAGEYRGSEISAGETIYMTVADKDGNMISLIQSNYRGMGSGMIPPGLGFTLQDRGELFTLEAGRANTYAPGKRPFHTIIPAFVTKDGEPFLSFGVMGGDYQPIGHAEIIVNMVDFGMNLQEAGDAPRLDHKGGSSPVGRDDLRRDEITLESGFDYNEIRKLMEMGHKVSFARGSYGGYQAIMWDAENKVYYGASESRKDGQAAGY